MDRQIPPVRRDPLVDVVLRCTTVSPMTASPVTASPVTASPVAASPVAASPSGPVSSRSVPSRAVSRFSDAADPRPDSALTPRLREVLIAATKRALLTPGAVITLGEIANRTGIEESAVRAEFAYVNALLTATMLDEIETVIAGLAHLELAESLVRAALALSESQLLESLDGAMLAQMARVDVRLPGWQLAAHAVEDALARAGRTGNPMVLRWLASYLCAPSTEDDIRHDVDILVAGLPLAVAHDRWRRRPTG